MAYRETIQIGNPLLKAQNKKIENIQSEEIQTLIDDMVHTMRENGLIGLAAPQIGENFKLFVTEPRETEYRSSDQADELRVYINPQILESSEEETVIYEGCGSVLNAGLFGPVKRSKTVLIEALDREGNKFQLKCDGALARVIQHEYDHLSGIEFTEKIDDYKKLYSKENYVKYIKDDPVQKENFVMTVKEVKYLK